MLRPRLPRPCARLAIRCLFSKRIHQGTWGRLWSPRRFGRTRISTSFLLNRGRLAIALNLFQRSHQRRRERFGFFRSRPSESHDYSANLCTRKCDAVEFPRPIPRCPRAFPSRPLVELHLSLCRDLRTLLWTESGGLSRDAEQSSEQKIRWLRVQAGQGNEAAEIGEVMNPKT